MDSAGDAARSLPGYQIMGELGQGGYGTVYRARQLSVGREVALKIDNRRLTSDRDKRRFMREVTAAGQLSGHPHVVAVYDAGVLADGRPYMVLELCPNGSLADRLRGRGPIPAAEVRDIGVHIADALAAAHAAGVLHRDVKPANILVNRYGGVALADFGLAVVPRPGMESSATREALTPAYASPEVFDLAEPTVAGDVYSLAATLYALLSGRPPYFPPSGSPSMVALMAARLGPVPDVPGAPAGLVAVLRGAMAYDPGDRPENIAAFRDALAEADLSQHAGAAPPYWPVPIPPGPGQAPPRPGQAPAGPDTEPAVPGRRGGMSGPLITAAIVVAVAIVAAGALVAYSIGGGSDHGTRTSTAGAGASGPKKDPYGGAETTARNCPAAGVSGASARCTATAECWSGIVAINGNVQINRSDCMVGHAYETFAIAPLPADGQTWNEHTLEQHPTVRRLCSRDVMARSRYGDALRYSPDKWSIEVIPPSQSQYESQNLRTFRCVATITGLQVRGAMFRPRS
ncbi:serine/threonine-protein kinase [Actinomadura sp. DC4]|uniref:serine/threonine-protein kinase n=1 Tax=Actinomadura sp. DC4 TaxID=3055069 RepID=UPI0025B095F5|nr:serine/threonine-protein kinase [Actinomadura sp. DC4]MDN3354230.1 serine/threonine-protein kinase [Actinomadura sp. DC4]